MVIGIYLATPLDESGKINKHKEELRPQARATEASERAVANTVQEDGTDNDENKVGNQNYSFILVTHDPTQFKVRLTLLG